MKLLIFDWDDVIILGSKDGYYRCYRETLKQLGVSMDEVEMDRRIKRKWGQPFREELRELLIESPELLDRACEIFYEEKFLGETFVNALHEVDGVNELLERLSKKYLLAVATGNTRKMIEKVLMPKFGIPQVFSQIVTAHEIPADKTKPNPYMLELILQQQNIAPTEACYVGDAENDMRMAMNAGVTPIAVLTGHLDRETAESLNVAQIIEDVTQVEGVLRSYKLLRRR